MKDEIYGSGSINDKLDGDRAFHAPIGVKSVNHSNSKKLLNHNLIFEILNI